MCVCRALLTAPAYAASQVPKKRLPRVDPSSANPKPRMLLPALAVLSIAGLSLSRRSAATFRRPVIRSTAPGMAKKKVAGIIITIIEHI